MIKNRAGRYVTQLTGYRVWEGLGTVLYFFTLCRLMSWFRLSEWCNLH
jgi:hypothetical protein